MEILQVFDKISGGKETEPPRVSWRNHAGGSLPRKAGVMLPYEILQRKSLFALLHTLDRDLAESTRRNGCPSAGGRCIKRLMRVNLGVAPRILLISTRFA